MRSALLWIWQCVFAPSGILSNERIDNLSSIGKLNELERVVGMDWLWGQFNLGTWETEHTSYATQTAEKAEKRTVSELEDEQTQPASKIVPRTQMCDCQHSKCEVWRDLTISRSIFSQIFVFHKPISIGSESNEKYNKVMLKKGICGKNLSAVTKSRVKTWNFTKLASR